MLSLARVVNIHPESHAVDLVFMEDGRRVAGVQVMSGSAGSNFGCSDLSMPDSTGYTAENTGTRDIYAVVSWVRDMPLVLGFLFPQVAQCLFADKERMVYRHASDAYFTIDSKGNAEFYHPSGAYMRFGTSGAHEDLTGKDYDKAWKITKNTGQAVNIHIEQAGGVAKVNIDPSGNVLLDHAGNLTTKTGGAMTADVTGNTTVTTPTMTINGNVVINGALTQGKGSAGGACSMNGPLTVTNDVVAGGKSLINHTHPDAQGGNTGPPN